MRRLLAAGAAWLVLAAGPSATNGSIVGRVRYVGELPQPVYVFESDSARAILAVDGQKGLSAAVAYIDGPPLPAAEGAPEIVVNQRNWWFTPGVVAVRAGQPVRFTNDDSSNHNVRSSDGAPANRFSAYTGTGEPYVHRFRTNPNGAPVVLTCDIHAWMMAWVYVFDHGHFALTGASGEFSIPGVPPGSHRLSVRHGPGGLARDVEVTVPPGGAARVEISFGTADLSLPAPR